MVYRMSKRCLAASALLVASWCYAAPIEDRAVLPDLKPVITTDFPDPSIIKVGGTWYAFGSQSEFDYKHIKVQVATSKDFKHWTLTRRDALGKLAPWVDVKAGATWAPSVSRRDDGSFLMYYSAVTKTAGKGRFHCVGTATSDTIDGTFNSNSDEPFACPTKEGGALDASAFRDHDGTHYALYKIDANAIGHGGICGNTKKPIRKTPIMIQRTKADGTTKVGDPVELISNSKLDGPLVEAPYMYRTHGGTYILFFSSQCWTTDKYDVSYATSDSPTRGFEKTNRPLFETGTRGTIGPGSASIAKDGKHFAMHGYASKKNVGTRRALYVTTVHHKGRQVLLH